MLFSLESWQTVLVDTPIDVSIFVGADIAVLRTLARRRHRVYNFAFLQSFLKKEPNSDQTDCIVYR